MIAEPCFVVVDEIGQEINVFGTTEFPIQCYIDDILKTPVEMHWHDEIELVYVSAGRTEVNVGGEKRVLKEGEGYLCGPKVLHSCHSADGSPCNFHSIVFKPKLVGGEESSIFWRKYLAPVLGVKNLTVFLYPDREPDRKILECIENAWHACEKEENGFEFVTRDNLSRIIYLLQQNMSGLRKPATEKLLRDEDRIKTMITYIQTNYQDELSMSDVAASASISTSEALRCFKRTIGMTPVAYIQDFRIKKARNLLEHTTMSMSEIADSCGFKDMSYFSKTFREKTGKSPTSYHVDNYTGGTKD